MSDAQVVFSVSTWRQPMPPIPGPARARLVDHLVEVIDSLGERRLRVAIDGLTASGKTSLGHELGRGLAQSGRPTLRVSLADFKRPWSEAHRYDRVSGEGYYRNAFDYEAVRTRLLDPSAMTADGLVALCSIDPLTHEDHSAITTPMPPNGVLIVDGVFACRPEIDSYWDLRVWLEVDADLSVRRGAARDAGRLGDAEGAAALHRDRYLASELLYIDEVDPRSFVEVIVDNTNLDEPRLVRDKAQD
jgi:uridine kinase